MKIVVLSASFWEMRQLIPALGLLPSRPEVYECGTGKNSISLHFTGLGQDRAREASDYIARLAPDLVVSTGFAGALRPEIRQGDLGVDKARSNAKHADTIADIAEKLNIPCHQGSFYSSAQVVMKSKEKIKLGIETGAIAVEMESQAIFETFSEKNVPLLFVRGISDDVRQDLPNLENVLDSSGKIRPRELFKIFASPGQWAGLIRISRGAKKAGESLARTLKEFLIHV